MNKPIVLNVKRARAFLALWTAYGISFSENAPSAGAVLEELAREVEQQEGEKDYVKSRRKHHLP
jgi:hypothetical protein